MTTSVLLLAYKLEKEGTYKSFFNDLVKTEPPQWHLSILVFNFEYSYSNRGITIQKIYDKPTEITYMDYTEVTKKQLDHYVNIVLPECGWTKENYDISEKNCQHFVHVILGFLDVDEPVPNYYVKSRNTYVTSYKNIVFSKKDRSTRDFSSSIPETNVNSSVVKMSHFMTPDSVKSFSIENQIGRGLNSNKVRK